MKKRININLLVNGWFLIILGIITGLFALFNQQLWFLTRFCLGIILIIIGVSYVIYFFEARIYKKDNIYRELIKGIIFVILGAFVFIPPQNTPFCFITYLIIGLYIIGIAVIRLIKAPNKKSQFFKDLFRYICGAFIIAMGVKDIGWYVIMAISGVMVLIGIIFVIVDCLLRRKIENPSIKQEDTIEAEYHVDDK